MNWMIASPAGTVSLCAAALFFQTGLLTGAWKYFCIRSSENAQAPTYVSIAHRAALQYSFAALLIAAIASLSVFSDLTNLIAVVAILSYFALATVRYIQLGIMNRTDNQHLNPPSRTGELVLLLSLIVAEVGGFSVLAVGFALRIISAE